MFSTFSLLTFLQVTFGAFVLSYLGCAVLEMAGFRIRRQR